MTCGVFASILSSFVLFLVLYLVLLLLCLPFFLSSLLLLLSLFLLSLLVLLSSACPLACLVCSCVIVGFVFSFSLSDYTQKERAQFLASSLVLLWVVVSSFTLRVQFLAIPVSGQSRSEIYHLVVLRLFPLDINLLKLPLLCQVVRLSGFRRFLSRFPKIQNCDLIGLFHRKLSLLYCFMLFVFSSSLSVTLLPLEL